MKIQLDYDRNIIKLESSLVKLSDFVEKIQSILPDWEEWRLETNTIVNWTNPIVIDQPLQPISPWWQQPHITYDNNQLIADANVSNLQGTYCLEVK